VSIEEVLPLFRSPLSQAQADGPDMRVRDKPLTLLLDERTTSPRCLTNDYRDPGAPPFDVEDCNASGTITEAWVEFDLLTEGKNEVAFVGCACSFGLLLSTTRPRNSHFALITLPA